MEKTRTFIADFETSVYDGQTYTEVWAAASVEMYTDEVLIFHSIGEMYDYYATMSCNVRVYFHNLKFDGHFWLSYLMNDLNMKQATIKTGINELDLTFALNREMNENTFKYSISDMGMWYSITIRTKEHFITIMDSLKLLPFSVEEIGKGFQTQHRKLTMEYKGIRYAGCDITPEEQKYIRNDVLVVKEAMEIMFNEGHKKITIGSCCLNEFKKLFALGLWKYDEVFPNLYDIPIGEEYGSKTAGDYIRMSYRGGWCYLCKGKEGKIYHNGTTADVNSLYPSVMSGESENLYPIGNPYFWKGNYIPDEALQHGRFYFVRIKTRFYIKKNKLPFIQIKSTKLYRATESLESSDVYNYKTGKYYPTYMKGGIEHDTRVVMTMTMTDYILFREHYRVVDFEILDGCWFYAEVGLFDTYINKYKEMKLKNKGAKRQLAKLFLNNLYGKMATNTDSSFKYAYLKDDKSLGFVQIEEHEKTPGYIPVGSAITSYARNFTIRAAQKNYHGKDKPGFIYADTDSIHCDLPPEQIKGIKVHDKDFLCWKLESCWDYAIFARQKTYIEHVVAEDLHSVDEPYNLIKCAGMPKRCKKLLNLSLEGTANIRGYAENGEWKEWSEEEKEFLFEDGCRIVRSYNDFTVGLTVPGKLLPCRIPGGVLLVETSYEMR